MNTPHQDFQKAKEELIDLLKHHEAVLFQEAEESIGQIPQISDLAGQMKAYQQEAVLFQKIEKQRAYEEAGEQADLIQHELENLPIVQDYRQKMQDASDLIQYVTKSIEERINEELRHG
ncbi:YlbF family regulator [Streptococcus thermophilus]|uniref:YlbF family regulator n=1 Tax=Streptococcus thermophilus TaxID=1308 RepID=UPI001A97EE9D|nr:YlbF family regulator [Streptococcus thermophilus]MBO1152656.1 YlbF family regulator [Streptococcus thermophilus]